MVGEWCVINFYFLENCANWFYGIVYVKQNIDIIFLFINIILSYVIIILEKDTWYFLLLKKYSIKVIVHDQKLGIWNRKEIHSICIDILLKIVVETIVKDIFSYNIYRSLFRRSYKHDKITGSNLARQCSSFLVAHQVWFRSESEILFSATGVYLNFKIFRYSTCSLRSIYRQNSHV